jgi:hypothetical protein
MTDKSLDFGGRVPQSALILAKNASTSSKWVQRPKNREEVIKENTYH